MDRYCFTRCIILRNLFEACFVLALCVAVSRQDTSHKACSEGPLPNALRVEGCEKSPCNIHKGTDLTAEWDFDASEYQRVLQSLLELVASRKTNGDKQSIGQVDGEMQQ